MSAGNWVLMRGKEKLVSQKNSISQNYPRYLPNKTIMLLPHPKMVNNCSYLLAFPKLSAQVVAEKRET